MSFKSECSNFILYGKNHSTNIFLDQIQVPLSSGNSDLLINIAIESCGDKGEVILESIKRCFDEFFARNEDRDIEEKFEQTLKEANLQIHQICKDASLEHVKIHSIVGIISDGVLLLTQSGNAEAYLLRKGKINVISDSSNSFHETDTFMSVASGELAEGDFLIISTSRLLRFLSTSQIISAYGKGVQEDAIAFIEDAARSNEEYDIAFMSLGFKKVHSVSDVQNMTRSRAVAQTSLNTFFDQLKLLPGHIMKRLPQGGAQMSQKSIFIGIFAVVVVLIMSISYVSSKLEHENNLQIYSSILEEVDKNIARARDFKTQGDNARANEIIVAMEKELLKVLNAKVYPIEAGEKSDKIRKIREEINNIERLNVGVPLADLSEKRSGVEAVGLAHFRDNLYAYDFNGLYKTILSVVEPPLSIGSSDESAIAAIPMPDRNLLAFYTKSGKIVEYRNDNFSYADTADEQWKNAVDLGVFKKNLYLLDNGGNEIWKYTRGNDSYSGGKPYIKSEGVDITNAVSFTIDGSVYVLNDGGDVVEFYAGENQDFFINGLPENILNTATQIFTQIDHQHLYFLDPIDSRVVVVRKSRDGQAATYRRQYILEGLDSTAQDLYIDEAEQKMYVLTKKHIYEIVFPVNS